MSAPRCARRPASRARARRDRARSMQPQPVVHDHPLGHRPRDHPEPAARGLADVAPIAVRHRQRPQRGRVAARGHRRCRAAARRAPDRGRCASMPAYCAPRPTPGSSATITISARRAVEPGPGERHRDSARRPGAAGAAYAGHRPARRQRPRQPHGHARTTTRRRAGGSARRAAARAAARPRRASAQCPAGTSIGEAHRAAAAHAHGFGHREPFRATAGPGADGLLPCTVDPARAGVNRQTGHVTEEQRDPVRRRRSSCTTAASSSCSAGSSRASGSGRSRAAGVERGETPGSGCAREVLEETGLRVDGRRARRHGRARLRRPAGSTSSTTTSARRCRSDQSWSPATTRPTPGGSTAPSSRPLDASASWPPASFRPSPTGTSSTP